MLRNIGLSRVMLHHLMRVLKRPSEHPFGSRHAVDHIVHYTCADFLAEIMGTLAVFGNSNAHTYTRTRTHTKANSSTHAHA